MKKLILLLIAFITVPILAFCQSIDLAIEGMGIGEYFTSLTTLTVLVVFVTDLFKKYIKVEGGVARLTSWLISIILCFLGWWLKLGIFARPIEWYQVLIYGVATGLTANGLFDIPTVKAVLNWILRKKKTAQQIQ